MQVADPIEILSTSRCLQTKEQRTLTTLQLITNTHAVYARSSPIADLIRAPKPAIPVNLCVGVIWSSRDVALPEPAILAAWGDTSRTA